MWLILISVIFSIKLYGLYNCCESRLFGEIRQIPILGRRNFLTFLMSACQPSALLCHMHFSSWYFTFQTSNKWYESLDCLLNLLIKSITLYTVYVLKYRSFSCIFLDRTIPVKVGIYSPHVIGGNLIIKLKFRMSFTDRVYLLKMDFQVNLFECMFEGY